MIVLVSLFVEEGQLIFFILITFGNSPLQLAFPFIKTVLLRRSTIVLLKCSSKTALLLLHLLDLSKSLMSMNVVRSLFENIFPL